MTNELMLESVKSTLKKIIIYDLEIDILLEDIKDDISLYEDGIGIDSINIVTFIVLIEEKFNITFESEEINSSMFESLNNLAFQISSKLN